MPPDDPENWLHEPWLTKPQLAEHLAVSDRWIEMQQHVGLPYLRMGGLNRYLVSEVEAWIREHYNSSPESS
jgi:predicted DNA-binding transcriptional regulator AlpA